MIATLIPRPAAAAREVAKFNLADDIGTRVDDLLQTFKQERRSRQSELDSPEALARLRAACEGRGARLVNDGSVL